jgi:hypothetical protein
MATQSNHSEAQALGNQVDNLIVHLAKCLREDVSVPHGVSWQLRQWPVNEDDHDSWSDADSLDKWYYMAYSILRQIDRPKADAALTDLVATGSGWSTDVSNPPTGPTERTR